MSVRSPTAGSWGSCPNSDFMMTKDRLSSLLNIFLLVKVVQTTSKSEDLDLISRNSLQFVEMLSK